jgi:diaminopimelate epimerase
LHISFLSTVLHYRVSAALRKKMLCCIAMRRISFTKAEGAQNDFVIVDDRSRALTDEDRRLFAQRTAHRRRGVGSDGTIYIDTSGTHDFTMHFYNPDGSVGSMCGNGGRCAALYAWKKHIAASEMRFEVLGRSYTASISGGEVTLSFPSPQSIEGRMELDTSMGGIPLFPIDTGAPHVVVLHEHLPSGLSADFEELDMKSIGRLLRHHEHFAPVGVNVNVLRRRGDAFDIRTFEKGVEDETEACGTGTIAAAIAAHIHYGTAPPLELHTHGGDTLHVGFSPASERNVLDTRHYAHELYLRGPARLVFDGEYILE